LVLIFGLANDGHHRQYRHHIPFFIWTDVQIPTGSGFDGENRFISFYLQDLLHLIHPGAVFDQPADNGHFFDGLP
jgi:hypothetical protein